VPLSTADELSRKQVLNRRITPLLQLIFFVALRHRTAAD
jgi:hypothetical protein